MADTFQDCLAFTLAREGGWADDPRDPGGCTMRGITLASFQAWRRDWNLTCAELRQLTDDIIATFYLDSFWQPTHADALPTGIDLMIFDSAVNIGIHNTIKMLQAEIGVATDGVIGPATLAATSNCDPLLLIPALAQAQSAYYQRLSTYPVFGKGWMNRVIARQTAALAMAGAV